MDWISIMWLENILSVALRKVNFLSSNKFRVVYCSRFVEFLNMLPKVDTLVDT